MARGWAFAAVDYTLAPDATLDQIVDECRRAVQAVAAAGAQLGFDPSRIVVAGSSAGAHLAAMVGAQPRSARDTVAVAGLVLVSGIYELEPLLGTTINEALGLTVDSARRNSPLLMPTHQPAYVARALVAYGENETVEFKRQSTQYAAHLDLAGVATAALEVEGRNHFDVILDLARPGTALGDAVAALVDGC